MLVTTAWRRTALWVAVLRCSLHSIRMTSATATAEDCGVRSRLEANVAEGHTAAQIRLMSFNVYWKHSMDENFSTIAAVVNEVSPDVASIQEAPLPEHRTALLRNLNNASSVYAFAPRSRRTSDQWWWDGAILYRKDKFALLDSGLVEYRQSYKPSTGGEENDPRGVAWAALQQSDRSDGLKLLVYGVHPVCCMGDWPAQEAVDLALAHLSQYRSEGDWLAILMGDLNSQWEYDSLDRGKPSNLADHFHHTRSTFNYKIDHIFVEEAHASISTRILQEQTWCNRGGSDHAPVVVDALLRWSGEGTVLSGAAVVGRAMLWTLVSFLAVMYSMR